MPTLYVATTGFLVIMIGLAAFRRGERWAWYSVLVFTLAGMFTGLLDFASWGGWYTFLLLGAAPGLGLVISAKSFLFTGKASPQKDQTASVSRA